MLALAFKGQPPDECQNDDLWRVPYPKVLRGATEEEASDSYVDCGEGEDQLVLVLDEGLARLERLQSRL